MQIRSIAIAAADSRQDDRQRITGYLLATLMIVLGSLDVMSTNLGLAAGAVELNPIVRWVQATLGDWWSVPKMLLHAITAAMVLWCPRPAVLCCVGVVSVIIATVVWSNFQIGGMF